MIERLRGNEKKEKKRELKFKLRGKDNKYLPSFVLSSPSEAPPSECTFWHAMIALKNFRDAFGQLITCSNTSPTKSM